MNTLPEEPFGIQDWRDDYDLVYLTSVGGEPRLNNFEDAPVANKYYYAVITDQTVEEYGHIICIVQYLSQEENGKRRYQISKKYKWATMDEDDEWVDVVDEDIRSLSNEEIKLYLPIPSEPVFLENLYGPGYNNSSGSENGGNGNDGNGNGGNGNGGNGGNGQLLQNHVKPQNQTKGGRRFTRKNPKRKTQKRRVLRRKTKRASRNRRT